MIKRTIIEYLKKYHFKYKKMVFLTGPRQVGKTTLAKSLLMQRGSGKLYYDWDDFTTRKRIAKNPYFFNEDIEQYKIKKPMLVFDEIHKYHKWKNYLKAVSDTYKDDISIFVTGSAKMDIFKKGGDSLFGRYFQYNLYPLSVGELCGNKNIPKIEKLLDNLPFKNCGDVCDSLFSFNGFPEPFITQKNNFLVRWRNERKRLIIREDIRDISALRQIAGLEKLMELLPAKIGSMLSINSLREDLEVAFETVKLWLNLLTYTHYIFSVRPYEKSLVRSIKKETKVYFWDWSELDKDGYKFENFIACHLQKTVALYNDFGLGDLDLNFIRDKQKREVDFLVTAKNEPVYLIEAKLNDLVPSANLIYFMGKLDIKKGYQIVNIKKYFKVHQTQNGFVYVISADQFLPGLL